VADALDVDEDFRWRRSIRYDALCDALAAFEEPV
jgi:hypothetical protein